MALCCWLSYVSLLRVTLQRERAPWLSHFALLTQSDSATGWYDMLELCLICLNFAVCRVCCPLLLQWMRPLELIIICIALSAQVTTNLLPAIIWLYLGLMLSAAACHLASLHWCTVKRYITKQCVLMTCTAATSLIRCHDVSFKRRRRQSPYQRWQRWLSLTMSARSF